jgi:predicted MFS family arabinose efflux permease
VTAVLLAGGGLLYSLSHAARVWRSEPHHHGEGHRSKSPLRMPGVVAVLLTTVVVSFGFGQLDVSIAATAQETLGDPSRLGLLFMAIAGGSAVGGLLYGARHWPGAERSRLPVIIGMFTVGLVALAALLAWIVPPLWGLMPLLFLTGLWIAPGLIVEANLIDQFAPRDRLNEAQSWLNTSFTSGGAAGNALAGVLIDAGGPARGFLGGACAMAVATGVAVLGQRIWRGRTMADQLADAAQPAETACVPGGA